MNAAWLERLKAERAELDKRLNDLAAFMCTASYLTLDARYRMIVEAQYNCMTGYLSMLKLRVEYKWVPR